MMVLVVNGMLPQVGEVRDLTRGAGRFLQSASPKQTCAARASPRGPKYHDMAVSTN